MKLTIDTDVKKLILNDEKGTRTMDLYSDDAFIVLSEQWIKIGWNQKYPYTFSWFGRPIIQLPEDLIRIQEVIYRIKPDLIIETGVAHGGSLIFYASICKAIEKGRVIGIDIEVRPHNRKAIEGHELFDFITLIEGSSVDPIVVKKVKDLVEPGDKVMVILDSNHQKKHVLAELNAYKDLVSPGSYMVATDGVMKDLYDVPRGKAHWKEDNPASAAIEFANHSKEFILEQPVWPFNESGLTENITHWPKAWLRRK